MSWEMGTFIFGIGFALVSALAPMIGVAIPKWLIYSLVSIGIVLTLLWPASLLVARVWKPNFNTLRVSLQNEGTAYAPGILVHGVKWQSDYREYVFTFSNEDENAELLNIRAYIEFPWVIVKYDVEENHGTQDARISQPRNEMMIKENASNSIKEIVDTFINTLEIDSVKMFPKARVSIRVIAWMWQNHVMDNTDGSITLKYNYSDDRYKNVKTSLALLIKHRSQTDALFIDKDNPILPGQKFEGNMMVRPREGVVEFGPDGSIANRRQGIK